uniref:Uncharacterized protein n=1 Tax=Chromera velia CCMP2878 TaxID=1169474 RepID=A0A0G4FIP3_9ALVE|eukprot:Cvel_17257.t1-p1 / transcript=Cvel_17257.t1 / gene=Cvel_17257 / organism=Chromera_velia_CCMP2878 / gene_product=hypothetical protein / transcript_product=hypothetical protein / location=Cvel_scaffold1367:26056-32914(-) / protein_length=526 / sequence_SO=supercontig / SO=protein_coding / is_pseudo=false
MESRGRVGDGVKSEWLWAGVALPFFRQKGSSAVKGPALPLLHLFLERGGVAGDSSGEGETDRFCLKSLDQLCRLRWCMLSDTDVEDLADCMGRGDVPRLERLDLEGNFLRSGSCVGPLERALRKETVPHLGVVNLRDSLCVVQEHVKAFLCALSVASVERPPNLDVQLYLSSYILDEEDASSNLIDEEDVRALGAGRHPCLRTLKVDIFNNKVKMFLEEIVRAQDLPPFESFDLFLEYLPDLYQEDTQETGDQPQEVELNEGLSLLDNAIEMGRLGSVRELNVHVEGLEGGDWEGNTAVFTALSLVKLPLLSELGFHRLECTEAAVTHFAQAFRGGALGNPVRAGRFPPQLKRVEFCLHEEATGTNVDGLIRAIAESEKGLPHCADYLDLRGERIGEEALASLAASGGGVSGGKLSHLEILLLQDCEIDDGRLKRWGEACSAYQCPKLRLLVLNHNRISLEGVWAFLDVLTPQSLPQLTDLHLDGQEGLESIEQQREFSTSVRALQDAAHAEGKLLKSTTSMTRFF